MKKLLLALTILTGTKSLHSMEIPSSNTDYSKLPPITLPLIYHHLRTFFPPEIAQYIFSLQPGTSEINDDFPQIDQKSTMFLAANVNNSNILNGHCLTVEKLKRNLLRRKISICDIKNYYDETSLHYTHNVKVARIFLEGADQEVWMLLTAQSKESKQTILHYIVSETQFLELTKLLLNTAGSNAQTFIGIPDNMGKTAFDIATPEVKEVMLQYLQNNQ